MPDHNEAYLNVMYDRPVTQKLHLTRLRFDGRYMLVTPYNLKRRPAVVAFEPRELWPKTETSIPNRRSKLVRVFGTDGFRRLRVCAAGFCTESAHYEMAGPGSKQTASSELVLARLGEK